MNCENCGGTAYLTRSGAELRCEYCNSCKVLVDVKSLASPFGGLRKLETLSHPPVACVTCDRPLCNAALDGYPVHVCDCCVGVLLSRDAFSAIVQNRRRAYDGTETLPEPIDPAELAQRKTCPRCRRAMETHPYFGPGAVVVDSCDRCDLIWLDAGELTQIERSPGSRR